MRYILTSQINQCNIILYICFRNLWSCLWIFLLSAWIWISAAACPWYEAWWGSHAKFLRTNGSTRPAGSASWWQKGWSCSARSATSSINAAAGLFHHFLDFVISLIHMFISVNTSSDGWLKCQMLPRGRVYRYPPGRGLPDVSMPIAGGMFSVPYDMGGMPMRDASISQPTIPVGALASALANATPDQQRTVCTALLYLFVTSMFCIFVLSKFSLYSI